jgi:carbonic anhydrase
VKSIPAIAVNRNRPVSLEKRVAVYDFLPTNTQKFYRYRGSLTIPNYDEVVIWTVFSVQSYLSKSQVSTYWWGLCSSKIWLKYFDL